MPDASQGAQTQMAVGTTAAPTTIATSSVPIPFISHTLARQGQILDTNAIRGTRSRFAERTRIGPATFGGTVVFHPDPKTLDVFLPRILGAAEDTDSFELAETLIEFAIGVDLVGDAFTYNNCQVNRATFRASEQGFVELELDILAKSIADLTFPTLTDDLSAANDAPYQLSDCVLTLSGQTPDVLSFEITIDNFLASRYANSLTPTSITPQDRQVTLNATLGWNSTSAALYGDASHGAGATESTAITDGAMVITNGNMSTTFTFEDLRVDSLTPSVPGKTEVPLVLTATSRKTTSADELVVTHDSTA